MIEKKSISKEEVSHMPKIKFPGKIVIVQTLKDVIHAVEYLSGHSIVGIDTETKPSFTKGKSHKVALLQISTKEVCFLFRLNLIGIPEPLVEFLNNSAVKKIGLSLKDDFTALHKRASFSHESFVELQEYVDKFQIEDKSLQKIYAILFGEKISKSQRLTNWEADTLSEAQQRYAATDAWACYNIYEFLEELRKTSTMAVNNRVANKKMN